MNVHVHILPQRIFIKAISAILWLMVINASHAQEHYAPNKNRLHYPVRDTGVIMHQIRTAADSIRNNVESAIPILHATLKTSISKNYPDGIGMSLFDLALAYSEMNLNDTAIYLYRKALPFLYDAPAYNQMIPAAYSNMAYIYYFRADYPKAIRCLDSAVRLLTPINKPDARKYLAITLNTMSAVYMRMGRIHTALEYLKQVERICRENEFTDELSMALRNQGETYTQLKQYDRAEEKYKDAFQLYKKNGTIQSSASAATLKSGYANLKLKQGKPAEAIVILQGMNGQHTKYRTEHTDIAPNYTLGSAFLQLKKYPEAEHYLLKALEKTTELNVSDNLNNLHKALADVYEATHRPEKALYHFKLYQQLQDSLLSNERAKDISEVEAKYRTAEQNSMIAAKELQLSKQKEKLHRQEKIILGTVIAALLLIAFFWIKTKLSKQKQHLQATQIQMLKQEQRISQLKAVMTGEERERNRIARDLHDGIVSQLMGIKLHFRAALRQTGETLHNRDEFEAVLQHLDDATQDLRKTAHNFSPETVLQAGLQDALAAYCDQMAKSSCIEIIFQPFLKQEITNKDLQVTVYRIVQELVQNAVKHADCNRIIVELNVEDNVLHLEVEDNGRGMNVEKTASYTGIGLQNVQNRVQSLGGEVHVDSKKGEGTNICIELHLEEKAT